MTWAKWHRASEGFASAGHEAERQGNVEDAVRHYLNAAKSEQLALDATKPVEEQRFAETAVSTATLWLKAQHFDEARHVVLNALGTPELMRNFVPQLRDLLDSLAKAKPANTIVESVISSELALQGRVIGAGNIRITGHIQAQLLLEGNIILDPGAVVVGNLVARRITVAGAFTGEILTAERVMLLRGGSIDGNVYCDVFSAAEGGFMSGHVDFG